MKQKIENVIRNKKVVIVLMECLIAIGCIVVFGLMMIPKDRIPDTTHSYSKMENPTQYEVVNNYMARVMPLTDYETFKEIAENTLNNGITAKKYTVKVYEDIEKTQEVTSGYIVSGMIVEGTEETESKVEESTEAENRIVETTEIKSTEEVVENEKEKVDSKEENEVEDEKKTVSYKISVIGDMTKDGDINVIELTKMIKCIVGLSDWKFEEEEKMSADLNDDGTIDISDIESCINYIVFGKLEIKEREYTVTFEDYDGSIISTKTDYHYGDKIEIPDDPTRESDGIYSYKFSGWDPEISETVKENVEYVATYKAIANQAQYQVEHYKEELDGNYTLVETENLTGTPGEKVTAVAKTYEGFSEDVENENRIVSGEILEDGSLTLKLFYNRNEYKLNLEKDDNIESVIGAGTYKYGETVTINASLKEKAGYEINFAGWKEKDKIKYQEKEEEFEMPAKDLELTASGVKKAIEYSITYVLNGGTNSANNPETYTIENNITLEDASKEGYTFEGWYEDENFNRPKTTEISNRVGNITLYAKFTANKAKYIVEYYKETLDGTYVKDENETEEKESEVNNSVTAVAKTIYGFTYDELNENNIKEGKIPTTEKLVLKLYYKRNKYTIEFKDYNGEVIKEAEEYLYEQEVELPENPTRVADDDYEYEFEKWNPEITKVLEDKVYIATYTAITYKIIAEKEDGTTVKYTSFEKALNNMSEETIKIQLIGEIEESITIPESKNITIDLNNHKISSNQENTIINNGNLIIVDNSVEKEGLIENTNDKVIVNNGNLTIGYDDGVVEENVIIRGQESAIQNNSNFYMYDGTLMGKTTIIGNNAIIPEGEEYGISIREEDGIQIAKIQIIEIPQALVGETYYMTLQEAINDNNEETIHVVKKNIEVIDAITIDATKNLTIDFNGNNITNSNNTGYVINNAGTLTIKNTNETNAGTINSTKGSTVHNTGTLTMQNININSYSYGVYNQKDLVIEDVNIESSNDYGVYNTDPSNDINFTMLRGSATGSSGIGNSKGKASNTTGNIFVQVTNATINGQLYSSTGNSKIVVEISHTTMKSKSYGIQLYGSNNELTLKDSKLDVENCYSGISLGGGPNEVLLENTQVNMTSDDYNQHCEISCSGDYNLVIDKNTQITSTNTKGEVYAIHSDNSSQNDNSSGHIKLIDGMISAIAKGDTKYYGGYGVRLNSGYFEFLGGSINATTKTIDANIGSIAEGKQIQTIQEEDKYVSTLVDSQHTEYAASIGEEKYYSLKETIAACESVGEAITITMLSDYEQWESLTISNEKNIILDLNGYKITAHSEFVNEGEFEITDTSENQTGTIEEKSNRAILNKENGIFTLSVGTILLNSTTLSKCAIYNTDQASININGGTIEVNNSKASGNQYIIYNISTGDIEITGGELKGDITKSGTLYGIYNYIDDEGGDRNVSISNAKIDISYNRASVYGIYNYTTHSSNVTDLSRDTINLEVSSSNINIEGSNTSPSYGIYNYASYGRDTIKMNLKNSTLDVNNNYYDSPSSDSWGGAYGIYNTAETNSSTFIYNNIEGGSIQATGKYTGRRYGIYNSGGNIAINLGIQGEESQKQEPSVLGDTYGINSSSSNTINFFQGIIKGKSAISETTILSLEEGKEINRYIDETDGYDTIVIQNKTPEAKIGETEYMTLQEAIDACPDDSEEFTTVELIKEVNNNAQNVTVEETKKVTLDIKGYNFTSLADHTIINNGDLNIIDSIGTGEIKNKAKIAIGNYGHLNVDNIKIYGYTSGITNYSNGNAELNQVEINSTSKGIDNQRDANTIIHFSKIIMDKGKYGIYNYGIVEIIDSEISVTYGESAYGIYNYGNSTTTTYMENINISVTCTSTQPYIYRGYGIYISSGTVNIGEKDNSMADTSTITSSHIGIYKYSSNDSSSSGILNYYGGTITAGERVIQGAIDDTPEDKTISIDTETQNMSLVDKQKENVVQVGDIQYATLAEAVETVSAEQEENTLIKVIADFDITSIEEQVDIVANQKVNLDLNGHTITSYINNVINNSGKLEIIDTSELQDGKLISVFNTGINNKSEFTLNQGNIQAVRNGVYNQASGTITINNGKIEVLADDRGASAGIYTNSNGTIKVLGGTIKAVKNKWRVWNESDANYIAGVVLNSSYAEIDGGNILVENSTNYRGYGILTNHSTIDFKSGILEVNRII